MYKIQTLNSISQLGIERFNADKYTIADDVNHPDAILVRSASLHNYDFPENLKAIARAGAGVNNIPISTCTESGIVVFNTPGANANAVKELVLTGMLLTSRKIVDGIIWTNQLDGPNVAKEVEKHKSSFKGPELLGKTIGVIGLGAIGIEVANMALSLGMEVYGYDPYLSVEAAWKLSKDVQKASSVEQLLAVADYVTLHIPLLDATKNYIGTNELKLIKKGARILNFSRGELIDNQAVLKALEEGQVSQYVTDFPTEELIHAEGVICIPHLGASTPESEDNCAVMAVNQLVSFLEDGNIVNSVNFPQTQMPRNGGGRLTVTNKNIPRMVGQITGVLADEGVNIADMINKHHDDLAYNIIDVDSSIIPATLEKIKQIEGVISLRYIQ